MSRRKITYGAIAVSLAVVGGAFGAAPAAPPPPLPGPVGGGGGAAGPKVAIGASRVPATLPAGKNVSFVVTMSRRGVMRVQLIRRTSDFPIARDFSVVWSRAGGARIRFRAPVVGRYIITFGAYGAQVGRQITFVKSGATR